MDTGKCAGTSTRCHLLHLARRRRARRRTRRELIAYHTQLTFLPDLAASLNNQSNTLSDLGQREEALETIEQATGIYRQLAHDRPDAFLPRLAAALNNQSNRLAILGRREEALETIGQAVTIRRQLAHDQPDAFLPDLATSLNNQSNMLADLGYPRSSRIYPVRPAIGPLHPELAALLGIWSLSQLTRDVGDRTGWRLCEDVAVLSCCTSSAQGASRAEHGGVPGGFHRSDGPYVTRSAPRS